MNSERTKVDSMQKLLPAILGVNRDPIVMSVCFCFLLMDLGFSSI